MVYAVQGSCSFNTILRRNVVYDDLTVRIGGETTWGQRLMDKAVSAAGDPGLVIEARFLLKARADLFWTDLIAELGTGITGPRPGSRIWRHDCSHDEGQPARCVTFDERVW